MSEPPAELKSISLLLADPSHASRIAALHHIVFGPAPSPSELSELLADPNALAFVATHEGGEKLVGYVIGRVAGDDAEILWIGVDGAWRRRGIGQHILGGFERAAQRIGLERMVFEVAVDNDAALALYQEAGFAQIASRPEYYKRANGQTVDAALLAKSLKPADAKAQ